MRELADNINQLYYRLFTTIKNLEADLSILDICFVTLEIFRIGVVILFEKK